MENDERPPTLDELRSAAVHVLSQDGPVPLDVVRSRLEDYAVAGKVLKRRRVESLAEAAKITVDERDEAREQLRNVSAVIIPMEWGHDSGRIVRETLTEAAARVISERDEARSQLAKRDRAAASAPNPDVISWDSRGLRLRRYLENDSNKLVRYAAKVGSVSFDLAVSSPHPNKCDATLTVGLSSGDGRYSTSNQMVVFRGMGATVALAAEEAMRDCDIRLLTLARELTWGLK